MVFSNFLSFGNSLFIPLMPPIHLLPLHLPKISLTQIPSIFNHLYSAILLLPKDIPYLNDPSLVFFL